MLLGFVAASFRKSAAIFLSMPIQIQAYFSFLGLFA